MRRSRSRSPTGRRNGKSRSRSPPKHSVSANGANGRERDGAAAAGGGVKVDGGGNGGGPAAAAADVKVDGGGGGGGGGSSRCGQAGCEFYGSVGGFCTQHALPGPLPASATAADRQRASDEAVKAFDRRMLAERYNRKFRPFQMSDPIFAALITEMKEKPINPKTLYRRLCDQKLLLTEAQARALMEASDPAQRDRYEDAVWSRCIDRDKLRAQSREGYYIHDHENRFFESAAKAADLKNIFVPFSHEGPVDW